MARVLANEINEALEEQDDIREMMENEEESLDDYRARMEWQDYQNEVKAQKEQKELEELERKHDEMSMQESPELWV